MLGLLALVPSSLPVVGAEPAHAGPVETAGEFRLCNDATGSPILSAWWPPSNDACNLGSVGIAADVGDASTSTSGTTDVRILVGFRHVADLELPEVTTADQPLAGTLTDNGAGPPRRRSSTS